MNRFPTLLVAALALLLISVAPASAMMVQVSQSGADSGEIMKGRAFTVSASGWSGSCSTATLSVAGCSSCSPEGEGYQKTIGQGSSVSWTTVEASQKATGQYVSVSVSGGCDVDTQSSGPFDIVLPPSLTLDATTTDSSVGKGSSFDINVDVPNGGETTANDLTFSASTDFTADCDPISSVDEGQSAGESCTVTAGSGITGGSKTVTITVSSSNADDATDTVFITVTYSCGDSVCDPGETSVTCAADCGSGGSPGTGGTGGDLGGMPPGQNASSRPTLVPGVGLRNNTRLQAAIEKVLAMGRMSEQARENLLRLSASITSDLSATRNFNVSGGKSRITTRIRYQGRKKARNFMLYESVPKTFANNASFVTVSAPGATVEVAEADPSWVIMYPEISPDQEITITYEVSGTKSSTVLDDVSSEIYASSLEEDVTTPADTVCTAGTKRCSGGNLEQCASDGTKWDTLQSCPYGCDSAALACKAAPTVLPPPAEFPWTLIAGVVIVAALVVVALVVYMKKFKGKSGRSPASALEAVKQDLGRQSEQSGE